MGYNALLDNAQDRLIHNGSPVPTIMYYEDSTCSNNRSTQLAHLPIPQCRVASVVHATKEPQMAT